MQELLAVPTVANRLGDYATHLSGVTNRLAHAEVGSNDFLEIKNDRHDEVPLSLRHLGECAVLHANDSGMNNKQLGSLTKLYGSEEKAIIAKNKTIRHFLNSHSHKNLPVFEDNEGLAVVGSNFWRPKPELIVYGRPYVSMNLDGGIQNKLSPVVALHELTHVMQKEAEPIGEVEKLARSKFRHELEAYYVAAQIILGMKDAGRQRELLEHTAKRELERALKIEHTRLNSQYDSDPFDPNNKVVKAMVDNKLGITSEVGKIIRDIETK